jgi:O-acetyl-ADP-ribose deacetylase (regulator of RNase III)
MQKRIGEKQLELVQGDITKQQVDAIVNAANSTLMGGGGVDGAIHRAGGPAILEDCKKIRAQQGTLPTGRAVITAGGQLPAPWVIHTVGPVWRGGTANEPDLLASCYTESLAIARDRQLREIAFPSISTGIFGYPVDLAASVALQAVQRFLLGDAATPMLVRFVLFDDQTMAAYERALEDLE